MTIGIFSSVDLSGNGASTTTPFGKGELVSRAADLEVPLPYLERLGDL